MPSDSISNTKEGNNVRKDWQVWTVHTNAHHFSNWAIGLDYYHEYAFMSSKLVARILQINLLFFNVTITRWQSTEWI